MNRTFETCACHIFFFFPFGESIFITPSGCEREGKKGNLSARPFRWAKSVDQEASTLLGYASSATGDLDAVGAQPDQKKTGQRKWQSNDSFPPTEISNGRSARISSATITSIDAGAWVGVIIS